MKNIASLARETGIAYRVAQNWADKDVFRHIPGTGTDGSVRHYDQTEVEVGKIISPLSRLAINVKVVEQIATFVRNALQGKQKEFGRTRRWKRVMDEAREGRPWYLIVSGQPEGDTGLKFEFDPYSGEADADEPLWHVMERAAKFPLGTLIVVLPITGALHKPEEAKND